MKITWIGHSTFLLEDNGTSILLDPFVNDNPAATVSADDLNPTVILISHAHNDHMSDAVSIAQRTGAPVISTIAITDWLQTQGIENVIEGELGGTLPLPNDAGKVKLVQAFHSSGYTTPIGVEAVGSPAGFIIRFAGKTIYFAGDTALFGDMALFADEGLDIAFLPIGDTYTMGPADAARAVAFLKAPLIIPMHYNTFPLLDQDENEFARLVTDRTNGASTVQFLQPGGCVSV